MNRQKGYIAIASMLVIAAVVTLIGTTVALTSISEAQIAVSSLRSDETLDLVEGCAEEALLHLNKNNSLLSTIILPSISCTVTVESQTGDNWTFVVAGTFSDHSKKIRIEAVRSGTISIISWQEIE